MVSAAIPSPLLCASPIPGISSPGAPAAPSAAVSSGSNWRCSVASGRGSGLLGRADPGVCGAISEVSVRKSGTSRCSVDLVVGGGGGGCDPCEGGSDHGLVGVGSGKLGGVRGRRVRRGGGGAAPRRVRSYARPRLLFGNSWRSRGVSAVGGVVGFCGGGKGGGGGGRMREEAVGVGFEPPHASASSSSSALDSSELSDREAHAIEWAHQPRRIALFVEPSPFAYICGYKNRFQNFIRYLREMGDEVLIVTTHVGVPSEFYGAKVVGSWSFPCPWYANLPLSLALSPRIYREVAAFKPDIIHASSPGIMVFGALAIAKLLGAPIVMSYHTHVPMYIPKYTFSWLVTPMWWVIKFLHRAADWTLVVSQVLGKEFRNHGAAAADRIGVWTKGVDSESFNPRFKSYEKRIELTNGHPETPLIVHVGRLGAEKNLQFLKDVMRKLPDVHIAFIGDGPYRKELEEMFKGMRVTFTGMLSGEELSQAYASGDVFITPSETETLGFVVLEAMASGVPVVAARAGGIIDIINKEGETGFMYTPGDLDECVMKLRALLDSPELREEIGRAGRLDVENFDWRASTRQVRNEMYTSAIWFSRNKRQGLLSSSRPPENGSLL